MLGFLSEPRDDEDLLVRRGQRILGPVEDQPRLAEHFLLAVGSGSTRRSLAAVLTGTRGGAGPSGRRG